ncbi:riboflavin synthase [Candidatus Fermentibacteria bacterium]|nr:riboflavin synthase [Candidatus Fermentibacteria bacterium]
MFTGLVETMGRVERPGARLEVSCPGIPLSPGESLAVDGACLTVVSLRGGTAVFDLSGETLERTIAGAYSAGAAVNLERPLAAGGRLHGHFVTGHVDCRGEVESAGMRGGSFVARIAFPAGMSRLVVEKGSVAVSGISLTVSSAGVGWLETVLVPATLEKTTARFWTAGEAVNLEFDILGKYVLRREDLAAREARIREYLDR